MGQSEVFLDQNQSKPASVTAPMLFAQGEMLPSVLFVCSQRTAAYAFSLQVCHQGADWLDHFHGAFSESVRRHVCFNAEARLTSAYGKAAGKHRQELSIKKLLMEQDVQSVLQDCVLPFSTLEECDAMATDMIDEINENIVERNGHVGPHVHRITKEQMRNFLDLFGMRPWRWSEVAELGSREL